MHEQRPCCLTVDFALTYFLVSGEIERCNVPREPADHRRFRYVRSDGLGRRQVLRSTPSRSSSTSSTSTTRSTTALSIIPGKVAVMKGEIQEKLPGWSVVVGTHRGG
ncbi:MAG: hypothetical protein ACLU9S_13755 [Oscillospiraceae bacterium]